MSESNGLPNGWAKVRLDEISEIGSNRKGADLSLNTMVNFVPMSAVREEFGGIDISALRPYNEVQKGYTQFMEGDVLFAKITPCMENGKVAVVPPLVNQVGYGSTEFHVLRPMRRITASWVAYFVSQHSFRHEAQRCMSGSAGQLRVPKQWLQNQFIPVAPSDEQRRIVAKIEELFSDLDAGVAALGRVKAKLKRYRASVLKAAVEGHLTAEWRKNNPPKETGNQLLQRILKARRLKWEEALLAAYDKAGKSPPKDWKNKYKEPAAPEESYLPELPKGWCWATAEQIGDVQLGRQRSPKNRSKDYPTKYLRAANLTEDGLNLNDLLEMEFSPKELANYRLVRGDVVLSEASGSPEQVGKPAVWNDEIPDCCFQNTVIRLRPFLFNSKYALTIFRHYYWNKVFAKVAGGVGINHLSAYKFCRLAIPMAPIEEQEQIVNEVELHLSILHAAEVQIEANLKRSSRLRQSILKRAFEGKLVPQDPKDEPASTLLERIKATTGNGNLKKAAKTSRKK